MNEHTFSEEEFAKLCNTDTQFLCELAHNNILIPEIIDKNGKSNYSYKQYQLFLCISCFIDAGMDLKEVKRYINIQDKELQEKIIESKLLELDNTINKLIHVRKVFGSLYAAQGLIYGEYDEINEIIHLENRAEKKFWATKDLDKLNDKEMVLYVSALMAEIKPIAVCIDKHDVFRGEFDKQKYLLIEQDKSITPEIVNNFELFEITCPEGTYGVAPQLPGEDIEGVYNRLLKSMKEFNEEPGKYFYEEHSPGSKDIIAPVRVAVQLNNTIYN